MDDRDDAYGRTTNPERFQMVCDHVERLLDDLASRYRVARAEGTHVDPEFATRKFTRRIVRLEPGSPDAAPLTVAFTAFPGVYVRFGLWHDEAYPGCGCDACDEDAAGVVAQIDRDVAALVAGRFAEGLTASTRWHRLTGDDWASSGETMVAAGTAAMGGPQERRWAPWPAAAAQTRGLSSR